MSDEDKLGAIRDIQFVIDKKQINEDLLMIAGDNLFEYNIKDFIKLFKEKQSTVIATRILDNPELAKKTGIVLLDENKKIIDFEEKPENPKSTYAATCAYLIKKQDLPLFSIYLNQKNNPDAPGYFMQWAHKIADIYSFIFTEQWFDIGNKTELKRADDTYTKK